MSSDLIRGALIVGAWTALTAPVAAEPVDLTGMTCRRSLSYSMQTWEFFGDVAIQYLDDGTVHSLSRIGPGAYEKIGSKGDDEGEWVAVYYFFDVGDGVQGRVLARPGQGVREDNPTAPLEKFIFSFDGPCVPIEPKP